MTKPVGGTPISARIVNRPRPQLPDRLLRYDEWMYFISDLACWKADRAEALLSGVIDD